MRRGIFGHHPHGVGAGIFFKRKIAAQAQARAQAGGQAGDADRLQIARCRHVLKGVAEIARKVERAPGLQSTGAIDDDPGRIGADAGKTAAAQAQCTDRLKHQTRCIRDQAKGATAQAGRHAAGGQAGADITTRHDKSTVKNRHTHGGAQRHVADRTGQGARSQQVFAA